MPKGFKIRQPIPDILGVLLLSRTFGHPVDHLTDLGKNKEPLQSWFHFFGILSYQLNKSLLSQYLSIPGISTNYQ